MASETGTGTRITLANVQVKKVALANGRVTMTIETAVRDMTATIAELNDAASDPFRANVVIEALAEQQPMDWNLPSKGE